MDDIIAGRTAYFQVKIEPTPTDLQASQVVFRLLKEIVYIEEPAGSVISEDTVSFTIDQGQTDDLYEGIYIFEVIYTHEGNEDKVLDGTVNVLRRI